MRGDPDYIDASCRERDRVARDKFREPDGWERDAREEERATISLHELAIRQTGTPWISSKQAYLHGIVSERLRILSALSNIEQQTAALWQEGTPVTKAVAAYTAAVRKIVEGEGK